MDELVEIVRDYPLEKYPVKASDQLTDGDIAAVAASDGKVQRATDATGITVRGVAKAVRDGEAELRNGIFCFKNDTTNPVVRKTHVGGACYVKDHETVDSNGGTYKVVAGLVVDVTADGVYVDMRLPALAAARALAAAAANAAAIAAL